MTRRAMFSLYLIGVGLPLLVVILGAVPGYMDADYYLMGGLQLARGEGFTGWVLWNYLDDPIGLPHASHSYWMPLASVFAAVGIRLLPALSAVEASQFAFIALAGWVPVLTAQLCFQMTASRRDAWLAGLFACLPSFYLPFLPASDTFALYMIAGGLFMFVLVQKFTKAEYPKKLALPALVLGLLAGAMHLARADGLLWLGMAIASTYLVLGSSERADRGWLPLLVAVIGGYSLVMGPWLLRNLTTGGTLLAPGGQRALWFQEYDQLFAFPIEMISRENWWSSGLPAILSARGEALITNLQTALAIQGQIFLAPLVVLGGWSLRRMRSVQIGLAAWIMLLVVMTLVFPFAGARGGFFHAGAAFQPLFWSLAVVGLNRFLAWGQKNRGWRVRQSQRVFQTALVLFAAVLTISMLLGRRAEPGANVYVAVEFELVEQGAQAVDRVMVNNPPGYFLVSSRAAVVIPTGGVDPILAVAKRYDIRYLVLEPGQGLDGLYNNPEGHPGLRHLSTVQSALLFEFVDE